MRRMRHLGGRVTCLLAAIGLGGLMLAPTAHAAQVAPFQLHARAGLKPIHPPPSAPTSSNTLSLGTSNKHGAVSPHPTVYVVFWGSQWSTDPAHAAPALQKFFRGLHGTPDTYDTILAQYCEHLPAGTTHCGTSGTHVVVPTTSILKGVWFDNAAAAPSRATFAQLASEATKAAHHFGNVTQSPNYNAQYVIASASGTHPDGFPSTGFCGYHTFTTTSFGNLAWTNLPYVPDLGAGPCTTLSPATALDGYFSTETHEYSETVTDFWPANGWTNVGSGAEIGDECINLDARITLPTGTFDVQGEWSNKANACVTHG